MNIRRYAKDESDQVWDVIFQATHVSIARDYHSDLVHRWAPLDRDMDEWAERLEETNPFVAMEDGKVVGMAELVADGFIDCFYVLPTYQGKGIGKALLSEIEKRARVEDQLRLRAHVSVTAEPFFSSQGFEIVERWNKIIIGHPAPQYHMEKTLCREPA